MALHAQPIDDMPLYKDPSLNTPGRVVSDQPQVAPANSPGQASPDSTEIAPPRPQAPLQARTGASGPQLDANALNELGFAGATDEIRFFDYTIVHLKDKNFTESSPNKGDDWGQELVGYILGATKQWQVQALSLKSVPGRPEAWDVADTKLDLFFTLDAPDKGPEDRFNRKSEQLSEWVAARQGEGKKVFDIAGKEYLMLNFVTYGDDEEIIVQVAPSSAKYRWPSFLNRLQSAARRSVPGMQNPAAVAEAMRNVRVKLFAGKLVETVDHPFYPVEFAVA